jgi:hypothetical protein
MLGHRSCPPSRFWPQLSRAKSVSAKKKNFLNRYPLPLPGATWQASKEREKADILPLPGSNDSRAADVSPQYKTKVFNNTLNLTKTKFDIRAYAEKREILFRKRTTEDLYKWQVSFSFGANE